MGDGGGGFEGSRWQRLGVGDTDSQVLGECAKTWQGELGFIPNPKGLIRREA